MATLLRPPLVFDRRQKRPIGFADIPPNLIESTLRATVLTLSAPLTSEQLDDSSPPRKKQVGVDLTPNLLTSTLFITTERLRQGLEQWDDSAPAIKLQVRVDLFPNLLGTTLSTPVATITLPLMAEQVDEASTRLKRAVEFDVYPNLLGTTLSAPVVGLALPLNAVRIDVSAPSRRYINQVEQLGRAVWRDPVPKVAQLFDSATQRKLQTRIDTTPNPVVLLQPLIRSWFESAPPRVKVRAMLDLYPSLNTTKLVPLAALSKPLGYPYDFSTPQKKYAIRVDLTPNMLVRGYPTSSIFETIPYLIGAEEYSARVQLESIHMVVVVIGSGGVVISQDVAPFTLAARGTVVTITMGGATYTPTKGGGNLPYNLH